MSWLHQELVDIHNTAIDSISKEIKLKLFFIIRIVFNGGYQILVDDVSYKITIIKFSIEFLFIPVRLSLRGAQLQ